ncbi:MAG: hypothetical protein WC934_12840 [Acidithiobacillus sp.]|jgi:hypothetical protein|uniref:hypothetical protein n=1 Tax=Acidithiobacillus sp. TaxID=1872118 RepID=UPI003560EA0E
MENNTNFESVYIKCSSLLKHDMFFSICSFINLNGIKNVCLLSDKHDFYIDRLAFLVKKHTIAKPFVIFKCDSKFECRHVTTIYINLYDKLFNKDIFINLIDKYIKRVIILIKPELFRYKFDSLIYETYHDICKFKELKEFETNNLFLGYLPLCVTEYKNSILILENGDVIYENSKLGNVLDLNFSII